MGKNRTKSNTSNNSSSGNSTNNPVQSDPNDPSNFQKDPRLKQSFYGLAYSPNGVIYPQCGAVLSDVITDIQLMSQLTKVSLCVRTPRLSKICPASRRREVIFGSSRRGGIQRVLLLDVRVRANSSRINIAYSAVRFRLRSFAPRARGHKPDQGRHDGHPRHLRQP